MQANVLLERAISHAGSAYKLAQLLGLNQSHISQWRKGRAIPVETVADLAGYLGEDVGQALTEAVIQQTTGTPRGERIARAVGKTLRGVRGATAAILAGLVVIATGAGSSTATIDQPQVSGKGRFRRWLEKRAND